jgi:hypothetical protein
MVSVGDAKQDFGPPLLISTPKKIKRVLFRVCEELCVQLEIMTPAMC